MEYRAYLIGHGGVGHSSPWQRVGIHGNCVFVRSFVRSFIRSHVRSFVRFGRVRSFVSFVRSLVRSVVRPRITFSRAEQIGYLAANKS